MNLLEYMNLLERKLVAVPSALKIIKLGCGATSEAEAAAPSSSFLEETACRSYLRLSVKRNFSSASALVNFPYGYHNG